MTPITPPYVRKSSLAIDQISSEKYESESRSSSMSLPAELDNKIGPSAPWKHRKLENKLKNKENKDFIDGLRRNELYNELIKQETLSKKIKQSNHYLLNNMYIK